MRLFIGTLFAAALIAVAYTVFLLLENDESVAAQTGTLPPKITNAVLKTNGSLNVVFTHSFEQSHNFKFKLHRRSNDGSLELAGRANVPNSPARFSVETGPNYLVKGRTCTAWNE